MKVKDLIEQLKKFDGELDCYAYEGEVTGIIIEDDDEQHVIYCNDKEPVVISEINTY